MTPISTISKLFVIILFSIFNLTYMPLFAQSSKTVAVSSFSGIGVSSGIDLYLTQSGKESVVIKGDEDVIKDVVVEQKNGSIYIKYKQGISWSKMFRGRKIEAYVSFKNLTVISASGGSDVETQGPIKAANIILEASGGSDMSLNLTCKDVTISISGGADISLKGSAENMMLNASGGSDLDAYDFKVDYAQANTSGGADAHLYVLKGLTANATGGSDITYKGSAALKKVSNSKSADITHVN
ncbi:head GIN domain-containing protein [Pedobacter sp. SL55]|uniref:head GIN domain-containing protein n=1 Tax=Pedobacter sp. SL55 TaxID=2995161 RepID=UPI00226EC0D5|nr:head GIN domain-containing protein [Pedobacter sp. SL55]WAC41244.1 DUF2807 domain-containing protein [Pedobacter sp. SL55]